MPFGFNPHESDNRFNGTRPINSTKKVYVSVQCLYTTESQIIPQIIYFTDGRKFEIDKITDVRQASSLKVGGVGIRYKVRVKNQETFLFYDSFEKKFFVEGKEG